MTTITTTRPNNTAGQLPFGIGHLSIGYAAVAAALLVLVAIGTGSYVYQLLEGEGVTGLAGLGTAGGATWGLYIIFVVYFVGVSFAGITIAAIIRLFGLTQLKPIARMAELLTIVALVLGALSVLADLGQPGRGLINLFQYARPQSPFFGTFSLVLSGYLFASLVYFYLDGRSDAAKLARRPSKMQWFYRAWAAGYRGTAGEQKRHERTTYWLALGIIPLLVIAHSTLGFVFGIQGGVAGWFSALQAPAFVAMAAVSGIGHIIVMAAIFRRVLGLERELPMETFRWLANVLWIVIGISLYFIIAEMLTGGYAAPNHEAEINRQLLTGDFAWLFWSTVALFAGSFVLLFGQFVTGRYHIALLILPAVLVNIAAITKRYLVVVPGQTHGQVLPYETGSYVPNFVEISIVVGLMALGAFIIMAFFKVFPILPVVQEEEEHVRHA
jgi:Ni/Fe-hydrogenase subunit HybB-like protein